MRACILGALCANGRILINISCRGACRKNIIVALAAVARHACSVSALKKSDALVLHACLRFRLLGGKVQRRRYLDSWIYN